MAERVLPRDYYFNGKDYSSGYHTDIPDELAALIDIDTANTEPLNSNLDDTKLDSDMIGWSG